MNDATPTSTPSGTPRRVLPWGLVWMLVWLIPLVALLGPVEWVLTAVALVLAQVWFFHYSDVFALGGYSWLVLVRDALIVFLRRAHAAESESPN